MSDFTNYAATHSLTVKECTTTGKQLPMAFFEFFMAEAVNTCKAYSGDVLYDLDSIREGVEHIDSAMYAYGFVWYLGFREMGVDHLSFIECRYDSGKVDALRQNYKNIYSIEMTPAEFGYVEWNLSKVQF